MSDAFDISRQTKERIRFAVAITFFAARIYKQTRHIGDKETRDAKVSEHLDAIRKAIVEEIDIMTAARND